MNGFLSCFDQSHLPAWVGLGPFYWQDDPLHHEDADLAATTIPCKIALAMIDRCYNKKMQETDKELHQGSLLDAIYQLAFGPNGTGVFVTRATKA
jgi:hypothetical protein